MNKSSTHRLTVLQWHIIAMFAPSFFTGIFVQKIAVVSVMLLGCLFNLGGIVVNLTGIELAHFKIALILLGVG